MLTGDVYLQRSQGKEEKEQKKIKGKRMVGNRSCGHGGGAEEAGWQVEYSIASKEGRDGRALLLFDCCLINPCKNRHSAFSTPWVG